MDGPGRAALPASPTEESPQTKAKGNGEQSETRPCQIKCRDAL